MTGPNRDPDQNEPGHPAGGARRPPPETPPFGERVMHSGFADRPVFREPPRDLFEPTELPPGLQNPEVELGGADAVPKTTYGSPLGAEPGGSPENTHVHQRKGQGTVTARVAANGGPGSAVVWVAVVLGVLAAVLYAAGMFT